MSDPWDVLTEHQQGVARRFLAERAAERRPLCVYLSGAHAYGFPSPDSDLDLKCVHVTPTAELVGLDPGESARDCVRTVEGVELDYTSNELGPVLRGILGGNGNYLERMLGDLMLDGETALLEEARAVVRAVLSTRLARHYAGFATSQLRAFDQKPTAKRALYVVRTAATGRCLLLEGRLETDVRRLEGYTPSGMEALLDIKRAGERAPLPSALADAWRERLTASIEAVESAALRSVLPTSPSEAAVRQLDAWLRDVRRRYWD